MDGCTEREPLLEVAQRRRGIRSTGGQPSWSGVFRRLLADHNVRTHGAGTKRCNHPVVGELTLAYEELAITAEPDLVLLVDPAEPGSPSAESLRLPASWAATAVAAESPGRDLGRAAQGGTRSAVHDTKGT